jgi:hypothetical protein
MTLAHDEVEGVGRMWWFNESTGIDAVECAHLDIRIVHTSLSKGLRETVTCAIGP